MTNDNIQTQEPVVYHYTTGNLLKKILQQKAILPDKSNPENNKEIPTVVFSSNPVWENTRFRVGKLPDGQIIMMSKPLLQKFDGGCFRIIVPKSVTSLDWHGMKDYCFMDSSTIKAIYNFAISVKARTSEWFATPNVISEDVWIDVQKLDENENWIELPLEEISNFEESEIKIESVIDLPEIEF